MYSGISRVSLELSDRVRLALVHKHASGVNLLSHGGLRVSAQKSTCPHEVDCTTFSSTKLVTLHPESRGGRSLGSEYAMHKGTRPVCPSSLSLYLSLSLACSLSLSRPLARALTFSRSRSLALSLFISLSTLSHSLFLGRSLARSPSPLFISRSPFPSPSTSLTLPLPLSLSLCLPPSPHPLLPRPPCKTTLQWLVTQAAQNRLAEALTPNTVEKILTHGTLFP